MYSGPLIIRTPLFTADSSGVWKIKIVLIIHVYVSTRFEVMVLYNFSAVLTIAIELLKRDPLLYIEKQQVAAG